MKAQRNTVQRQIVLDAVRRLDTHPTIEEVYTEIHTTHPAISKTTVYRNLRQLARNGAIRKVSLPDGLERYDGHTAPHYHFVCNKCKRIFDVDIGYPIGLDQAVQEKYGFLVDRHETVFSGMCKECKGIDKDISQQV